MVNPPKKYPYVIHDLFHHLPYFCPRKKTSMLGPKKPYVYWPRDPRGWILQKILQVAVNGLSTGRTLQSRSGLEPVEMVAMMGKWLGHGGKIMDNIWIIYGINHEIGIIWLYIGDNGDSLLSTYGGFQSHGGTPNFGLFISWKIPYEHDSKWMISG